MRGVRPIYEPRVWISEGLTQTYLYLQGVDFLLNALDPPKF